MTQIEFNLERRVFLLDIQQILDKFVKKKGVDRKIFGLWISDDNYDQGEIKYEGNEVFAIFKYELVGKIYECTLDLQRVPEDIGSKIVEELKQRFSVKPQPVYSRE